MKIFDTLVIATLLSATVQLSALAAQPEGENNQVLYDPTRPNWFGLKKKKSTINRLVLNSLVMSPQRRIAVINGELMREGDTKRGITVQQILDDRVLVTTTSGKKRVLKLENAKKQAHNQIKRSADRQIARETRSESSSEKGITR